MKPVEICVRPYDPKTDEALIYSTWTQNAYYSAREPIHIPKKQWFADKIQSIKSILERCPVFIACSTDDPDFIVGYMVVNDGGIEWLYIKKDYRKEGVDTLLKNQIKENENGKQEPEKAA